MPDTTIKKVEAGSSPQGEMGQKYLVAGKRVSMRLWVEEPGGKLKAPTTRDYETVGYVISGSAKLDPGRTDPEFKGWRLMVGAGGSDAPIHDYRAVHGRRGDRTTGRGSWSRHADLSRNAGLHLRRLRPGICHDRLGPIELTWIFEARAMASNPNDQKKRSSAMRTVGEGVPPRSAVVPTIGAEENKRNRDERPSKQPVRKKKRNARSISNSSGN